MARNRIIGAIIAVLIIAGAAFAVIQVLQNNRTGTVQVGVILPLEAGVGQQMLTAIELALANHESTTGRTVELYPLSYNASESDERKRQHREAIETFAAADSVVAVIGAANTSFASDVIAIANEASLPIVSPAATWPGLTQAGYGAGEPGIYYPTGQRNFFRTIPTDDVQALAALEWLSQLEVDDVFLLTLKDNTYSTGLGGIILANAADYEVNVVGQATYDFNNATEAHRIEIAEQIQASNAQALYYPAVIPLTAYSIVTIISEYNPDMIVFGSEGMPSVPDLINEDTVGDNALYATSLTPDLERLPAAQDFITQFEAETGEMPVPFAVTAHDAMVAILTAIDAAPSSSREAVHDALAQLENVPGSMGDWRFDENGDTTLRVVSILQFQDGDWQTIRTLQP